MADKKRSGFWWVKGFLFSLVIFSLLGCATRTPQEQTLDLASISPPQPSETQPALPELKPIFKEISPFETRRLSLSVREEDAIGIFYLLAREAGLNLVIESEVFDYLPENRRFITAEFHDYTLKEIFESICRILDLTYEIQGGIIYIKAFEEKLFDLSFLQTLRSSKFSLRGDVLGGESGGTEFVSPLKGQYELSGETTKDSTDIYKQLEASIKVLLSKDGTFTFNRLTGNLFVRDHPSRVKRVAELVERLKSRYGRQVLIEAKIVEVVLSRSHDLGIDWREIKEASLPNASAATLDLQSTMATVTFTFTYQHKHSFEGILKLLESYGEVHILSNPRLRILNGQPALISVGRSMRYIKKKEEKPHVISVGNIYYHSWTETTVYTDAVFRGLLLGVTPHITETGEIILHIVPIKTDVELKEKEFRNIRVTLPQVDLREMSTVIKVTPHDLVVIGGLILDKKSTETRKVWGLGRLPGLGSLFTHSLKDNRKLELVILLKVSLV